MLRLCSPLNPMAEMRLTLTTLRRQAHSVQALFGALILGDNPLKGLQWALAGQYVQHSEESAALMVLDPHKCYIRYFEQNHFGKGPYD